jgi:uncharacterized protein YbjT (DUF2867 family)
LIEPGRLILVTGSTGYVGRHLIPHLLERGYRVRCLVHTPARLKGQAWLPHVDIVVGDIMDRDALDRALEGVSSAYYLIHCMSNGSKYSERDLTAAGNFAEAAGRVGIEHIVYLGGLANPETKIGMHLLSRIQTGQILRQGKTRVTEFRASLIIGTGSISFEMIRYLTEQFPILVGPRWLYNRTQPIAIQNVLYYLLAALELPASQNLIYEIGGRDSMTYAETMLAYARLRGLKRRLLVLPGIPLKLMAYIVDRLTPVPSRIAGSLIGGMRGDSIVHNNAARKDFPQIRLLDYQISVDAALSKLAPEHIAPSVYEGTHSVIIVKDEGFFIDHRQTSLDLSPEVVYQAFIGLGGKRGWLYLNVLWQLRGLIDRLMGGPGMRGRQEVDQLEVGAIVDFYRVETLEPGRMLRLRAELNAPGVGWLEWRTKPQPGGGALLSQILYFVPHGFLGFLYWHVLSPVHRLVNAGLLKQVARRAYQIQRSRNA